MKTQPVLKDESLYLTDNGACYCGKHCGSSARFTGRDISGQKVHALTVEDVRESIAAYQYEPACETCGRTLSFVAVA